MLDEPGTARDSGPVAYFLTWTTYGSWLPGDERGWASRTAGLQRANPRLHHAVLSALPTASVTLTPCQRHSVEEAIHASGRHHGWVIHAGNCRTQHVHVVVSASRHDPRLVLRHFKAWSSRALTGRHEAAVSPKRWWTRGGSVRLVFRVDGLERVIEYVRDFQECERP